jgi:hypothetical protein
MRIEMVVLFSIVLYRQTERFVVDVQLQVFSRDGIAETRWSSFGKRLTEPILHIPTTNRFSTAFKSTTALLMVLLMWGRRFGRMGVGGSGG